MELSEWAPEHNKDYIILIAKDYRVLAVNKELQSTDLFQEYQQFKTLFKQLKQYVLSEYGKHNYYISLQNGKTPTCKKIYQISEKEFQALKKYINKQLKLGKI